MKKLFNRIVIALLLGALPLSAFADTCGKSLTGVFTAYEAVALCKIFGSAVNHSLIPGTDNTFDLGSSSYGWRTAYVDTSVITPKLAPTTSQVVQVESDAQRLFTFDGSSDTALTLKFGDGGTTAAQVLTVSASTADADDDSDLALCGGGGYAADGTRGSCILLRGEEGSGGGDATYTAGAGDTHIFNVASATSLTISSTSLLSTVPPVFSNGQTTTALYGTTSLNTDMSTIGTIPTLVNATDGAHGGMVMAAYDAGAGYQAYGPEMFFTKTRSTSATLDANTIVQSGDILGRVFFRGADGANYKDAAAIVVTVNNTPGTNDMPGKIDFQISPDGSATLASVLSLADTKAAVFTGTVTSSATSDIGWSVQSAANQACNTTCTSACVVGQDSGNSNIFVGCSSALADVCLCAGAS